MVGTLSGPERRLGAALGAGQRDMAERVGALVAEGRGVGRPAAADRIHHHEEGARHQTTRSWISGASAGAVSAMV